jgi:cyclohexa-1,5-dienecarbonyl-CoA hydratase
MASASEGKVSVRVDGSQAEIAWERPPLNVFTADLLTQFGEACRRPEVRAARVVLLRGSGRCWSAGFSVEEHLRPQMARMLAAFREALEALWDLPGVTLAQVHGPCLGGGMELLMGCDLSIASTGATFGQPEIRLGVFAPFGAAFYPEVLGSRRAAEILFTGAVLDASRAEALGIIGRTVPEPELPAAAALTAATVSSYRPEALRLLKRTIRESLPNPWARLDKAEQTYLDELMAPDDAEEGLKAFLQKRAPVWRTA